MANSYNLDDLRNDLDAAHQSVELDIGGQTITLVNAMRLTAPVRKQVMRDIKVLTEQTESETPDAVIVDKAVNDVLSVVVADNKGKYLTDKLAGDTSLALRIFDIWLKVTQAGEA